MVGRAKRWLAALILFTSSILTCGDDVIHLRSAASVCLVFFLCLIQTTGISAVSCFFPPLVFLRGRSPPTFFLSLRCCFLISPDFVNPHPPRRSRGTGRAAVHLQRPDVRAGGPLAPLPGALRTHVVRALRVHRGGLHHQLNTQITNIILYIDINITIL